MGRCRLLIPRFPASDRCSFVASCRFRTAVLLGPSGVGSGAAPDTIWLAVSWSVPFDDFCVFAGSVSGADETFSGTGRVVKRRGFLFRGSVVGGEDDGSDVDWLHGDKILEDGDVTLK